MIDNPLVLMAVLYCVIVAGKIVYDFCTVLGEDFDDSTP